MYSFSSKFPEKSNEKPDLKTATIAHILQYTNPVFKQNGFGAYIEFSAFDPERNSLRRKIIRLNRIKRSGERKKYAAGVIKRLTEQLQKGWNPWIVKDTSELQLVKDSLALYQQFVEKMLSEGLFRPETYASYKSYLKIIDHYLTKVKPIYYLYQFDRNYCVSFLDWVFIDRKNSAQTRNNYLTFLKVVFNFLIEKGLIKHRPTDGIRPISKRLITKQRTTIPAAKVKLLSEHLRVHNPSFLLACYLLYYCFIRPVEMCRLKISYFNIKDSTITIPGEASKNKKEQTVSVPKKVLLFAIDLGIFNHPSSYYVFSNYLRPGKKPIGTIVFRHHWANVSKALRFLPEWKFYSLKDTGITEMCEKNLTSISIRDQARHSSLAITDIYTNHRKKANSEIVNLDGAL